MAADRSPSSVQWRISSRKKDTDKQHVVDAGLDSDVIHEHWGWPGCWSLVLYINSSSPSSRSIFFFCRFGSIVNNRQLRRWFALSGTIVFSQLISVKLHITESYI